MPPKNSTSSMVGRILTHLKRQGRLVEAPRSGVPGSRRALRSRPYAMRKPRQYAVSRPGDLVEVDTMDVRPVPGCVFKQFTARDLVSRWDVIQAHSRATAVSATDFLDTLQHRMPFPIRALQVDGGSEFAAQFEQACRERGLHLFVLPPRSPKLNGAVERANRTHAEEFYQITPHSLELHKLNRELRDWEKIYTTVRPHQALGYLTPHQFLHQISSHERNENCHPSTGRVQILDNSMAVTRQLLATSFRTSRTRWADRRRENLTYESLSTRLHERFPQLAEPKYTSLIGNIDVDPEPFVLYGVIFNHFLKELAGFEDKDLKRAAGAFLEGMAASSDSHVTFLLAPELLPTLVRDQSTIDSFWSFLGTMTRRQVSLLPPRFLRKIDLPVSG